MLCDVLKVISMGDLCDLVNGITVGELCGLVNRIRVGEISFSKGYNSGRIV